MSAEMGTIRVDIEIENPSQPGSRLRTREVLVDTGAELSWIPSDILEQLGIARRKEMRFRRADGTVLSRWTGSAWVYASGTSATDDVVFGQPGDLTLLGARSLEGLNLRIDPVSKTLVDAGPAPAAAAAETDRCRYLANSARVRRRMVGSPAKLCRSQPRCPLP